MERRKHSRYSLNNLRLTLKIGDTTYKTTECSNISMGGMCIVVDNKVDESEKYGTLTLIQRNEHEEINFNTSMLILWSNFKYVDADRNDTQMGVKFKDLDSDNLIKLKKIISHQPPHHN